MTGRSRPTARVASKDLAGPKPAPEPRLRSRRAKSTSRPSKGHVALPLEVKLEAQTSDP
jgi:hypothetical protein